MLALHCEEAVPWARSVTRTRHADGRRGPVLLRRNGHYPQLARAAIPLTDFKMSVREPGSG